jgi:ketosteroid isomerase-like protein
MPPLPRADAATREAILRWLDVFSGHVREVDYAAARPLWHPDVLAFGTHRDVMQGLEMAIATQWDNVWPKTADFRFDLLAAEVLASGDMAVAVAPWTSTGFHPDGTRFERPGRATLVFLRTGEALMEGWRCVHSHLSLNRGVPQSSHADRPVKAR